jgi:hypothetical protein
LHDSQRTSDDVDIEHGIRARDFVVVLINQGILSLTDTQARLLKTACEVHNTAYKLPMDPTISVCLDADRLDLWRLGVQPSEKLLFTEMGKKISKDKTLYYQICG